MPVILHNEVRCVQCLTSASADLTVTMGYQVACTIIHGLSSSRIGARRVLGSLSRDLVTKLLQEESK
jgi:hypothetical protein